MCLMLSRKRLSFFLKVKLPDFTAPWLIPSPKGTLSPFGSFFSLTHCCFLNKCIYLFIYFWLCWVFVAARGFSLVAARGGAPLRCCEWASQCGGFSCCRARALGARASVVVARGLSSCGSRALECRLSSCGVRA